MSGSFLTKDELIELTDRQLSSKQIDWLQRNAWKYAVSAAGRPKVSRDYFDFRMGWATEEPTGLDQEPDFSIWINKERR